MSYSDVVLADKPWGYWRLNEPQGATTVADSSGNGRTGAVYGGVTFGQSSLLPSESTTAALFDGTTAYISLPLTGLPTGAQPWSIEAWVLLSTLTPPSQRGVPVGFGTYANSEMAELQYYATGPNEWVLSCYSADIVSAAGSATLSPTYLCGVYDGVTTRLYVNGVQVAANNFTLALTLSFASIGAGSSPSTDYFYGVLAETAIYTTALAASQVVAHYMAGIAPAQPALGLQPTLLAAPLQSNATVLPSPLGISTALLF